MHHNLLSKMNCAFNKNAPNCKSNFYVSLKWCFYYQSALFDPDFQTNFVCIYMVLPEAVLGVLHILINTERSKSNAFVTQQWIMQQQPVLRQGKISFSFHF